MFLCTHVCQRAKQSGKERKRKGKKREQDWMKHTYTRTKKLNNILITERMTFADEAVVECVVCAFIPSNNIALGVRDPHGLHLLVSGINEKRNQPTGQHTKSTKEKVKKEESND